MLSLERQNKIMEILKLKKSVRVSELAEKFYICESTIRRDLIKLEKKGYINRSYGGALLLEGLNTEIPLSVREHEQLDGKNEIGKKAAGFVQDGDCMILDSSSTTFQMIKYLRNRKDLVIITNGLKTAAAAGQELDCRVYCTGGVLRENSSSLVGYGAEEFIRRRSVQKLFFSCRSVSLSLEAMDVSDEEAELRKIMIECAEKAYLLCDHTKLGNSAFNRICHLSEIGVLITDISPEPTFADDLKKSGLELLC